MLDEYFELREKVFEYFGYVEDWRAFALSDARGLFWYLTEDEGDVIYADDVATLHDDEAMLWSEARVYPYHHLKKWVYRTEGHTMVLSDTRTDGNILLFVFDNDRESPPS